MSSGARPTQTKLDVKASQNYADRPFNSQLQTPKFTYDSNFVTPKPYHEKKDPERAHQYEKSHVK